MNQLVVRKNKNKMGKKKTVGQELIGQFVNAAGSFTVDMLANAVRGIASAYRSAPKGNAGKQEMRAAVAPLAASLSIGSSKGPRFTNVSGGLKLEHVEPLQPIAGEIHMMVTSESFRWLGPIASGFEEYRIKMEFCWVPTCPASSTGRVMIAFDYDPIDSTGYHVNQDYDYLNTQDHCVSAVWAPCAISPVASKWLMTGTNGDERLVSPGRVHAVAPDVAQQGFFLVRYQVEFRKPQPQTIQDYIQRGHYTTSSDIFGGISLINVNSVFDRVGTDLIQRQPGSYVLIWCTDAAITSFTATTGAVSPFIKTQSTPNYYIMWHSNSVGNVIGGYVAPTPGGPTSYKLTIIKTTESFALP